MKRSKGILGRLLEMGRRIMMNLMIRLILNRLMIIIGVLIIISFKGMCR